MKFVRGIKIISYTTCAIVCGIAMQKIGSTMQATRTMYMVFDDVFSDDIKQKIATHIEEAGTIDDRLVQKLKELCPLIANISSSSHVPGQLRVHVAGYQPQVAVNDDLVMTTHGDLLIRELFAPLALIALPCVMVARPDELCADEFQLFVQGLHKQLIEHYDITWWTPFKVRLRDKEYQQFSIVCSHDHVPTAAVLIHCEQIKRDVHEKKRNFREWTADVRFENQIVVRSAQRGKDNGQSIFR